MSHAMVSPSISVVIPTYNRAHCLSRAIRSVLNQSYKDFEVIVVDDCSTDETESVVRNFKDDRIIYVRQGQRLGAACARNEGIRKARGEFIAFQDSDDEWLPEKLHRQMDIFRKRGAEVGVVYSAVWYVDGQKKTYFPQRGKAGLNGNISDSLLAGNFVTIQTLVRRECFQKSGMFDENLPRFQDWDMWLRIAQSYQFAFIDEPLALIYKGKGAISEDPYKLVQGLETVVEKYRGALQRHRTILGRYYYALGRGFYEQGQLEKGRDYLKKAWRYVPYHPAYMFFVLVSLCGANAYKKITGLRSYIKKWFRI